MQIIILLSFFLTTVFAELPTLSFEGINGEYTYESGRAYAPYAEYKIENVTLMHKDIEVKFNRSEKNLLLKGPNTIVHFDFDFSFLNLFKRIDFEDVYIFLNKKGFKAGAENLDFNLGQYKYVAKNVVVESDIIDMQARKGSMEILEGLIKKGKLKIDKIKYKPAPRIDVIRDLLADGVNLNKISLSSSNILKKSVLRWFKVSISDGNIRGSVLIDSWINAWLKFYAKIQNDSRSRTIEIKLTKAKLGIFSVKKFVLKALKKLNSDKITVKGNIIKIDLAFFKS